MKEIRGTGPRPDDTKLLREEMLYYRLARLKREYLHGLERIDGMLSEVKSEHAQRLGLHQLLCLADSSVDQSLQALDMVTEVSVAEGDITIGDTQKACGFCGLRCQYASPQEVARRVS